MALKQSFLQVSSVISSPVSETVYNTIRWFRNSAKSVHGSETVSHQYIPRKHQHISRFLRKSVTSVHDSESASKSVYGSETVSKSVHDSEKASNQYTTRKQCQISTWLRNGDKSIHGFQSVSNQYMTRKQCHIMQYRPTWVGNSVTCILAWFKNNVKSFLGSESETPQNKRTQIVSVCFGFNVI